MRDKVVTAAKALAIQYKNSAYQMSGKSTNAFDCSYFIYLVFSSIFNDYQYLDSAGISSSPSLFEQSRFGAFIESRVGIT